MQIIITCLASIHVDISSNNFIISLNFKTDDEAFRFLDKVDHATNYVRVTNQLFFPYGTNLLQQLFNYGYKIFLDIRLSDVPLGMASSILSLTGQPIDMLSVQLSQGIPSLYFSKVAIKQALPDATLVGTTMLYHLQNCSKQPSLFEDSSKKIMLYHAKIATQAKIYNFMCTPYEWPILNKQFGQNLSYIIYGADSTDYQSRQFFNFAKDGVTSFVLDDEVINAKDPKNFIKSLYSKTYLASITENI